MHHWLRSAADDTTTDAHIDEAAEELVNPRPSAKGFASLAEREQEHATLFQKGMTANAAGNLDAACAYFEEAYALLFRTTTLLSLINMKLKLGEAALAAACYTKVIQSHGTASSPTEMMRLTAKLAEARQLHSDVHAIMNVPQAGLLNTPEERARAHKRLVDRAHAANERGERAEAERLFLEAWPLLFRVST